MSAEPATDPQKGTCLPKNSPQNAHKVVQSRSVYTGQGLDYQCKEFEVMTLQDALVAYRTYARAEGKSPKTVDWVVSSVGYFADFLGLEQQDIGTIKGNDIRRFIIALQEKPKFSNHPYNKPQTAKLSARSIETYCRDIRAFFAFLEREGFIESNVMARVNMPKVPEIAIPTFSEKEIARLLAQTDSSSNEGFRDYCLLLTFIDTDIRIPLGAVPRRGDPYRWRRGIVRQ
ncbi:tyrosine-type recombinase/integrase [Chloroflexota bacterium]